MHKDIERMVSSRHGNAIPDHNRAMNIVDPAFNVGDFVLVCYATNRGHKLH